MQNLKFAFFGTPDVASKTLEILKSRGYVPSLIVTAPDRPVGRHFTMTPSPVKVWADENGIETLQPEKINEVFIQNLIPPRPAGTPPIIGGDSRGFDLFIVVAYGKILPQALIDIPKLGTLNIHYSLLPKYRGASPVEAAILNGDTETGVSIQKMVFKLDAGPVIASETLAIAPDDTTPSLREKLITIGAELLARIIPSYVGGVPDGIEGGVVPEEQDESLATHCGKTKKEDGLVDPFTDNPNELWRKYRAYQPWPGLYFMRPHPNPLLQGEGAAPKRVKIKRARFEDGKFIIERITPEGEKEMDY